MKRLRRALFNAAAGMSLILALATIAIWAASLRREIYVALMADDWTFTCNSGKNILSIRLYEDSRGPGGLEWGGYETSDNGLWEELKVGGRGLASLGIVYRQERTATAAWLAQNGLAQVPPWKYGGRRLHVVYAPHWLIVLLLLAFPMVWAMKWSRVKRRMRAGMCLTCGYDLRATPERCPECGTVAEAAE